MSKPILVVFPEMLKSHVDQYTRADGTVVQAHDDKRQAAAPKPAAGGGRRIDYLSMNSKKDDSFEQQKVGKAHQIHNLVNFHVDQLKRRGFSVADQHHETNGISEDSSSAKHAGNSQYLMRHPDGREAAVYRFEGGMVNDDDHDGPVTHHRIGVMHKGADHNSPHKKQIGEPFGWKHAPEPKLALPVKKAAAKPAAGGYVAPKEGEVGHHEHTEYGAYFRPGDKVKDQTGKTHEVAEHRGASVRTKGGEMFHPTKLKHAGEPKPALPVKTKR